MYQNISRTEAYLSSLMLTENNKEGIPTALEVFPRFETNHEQIIHARKHTRNARVTLAVELVTIYKNN